MSDVRCADCKHLMGIHAADGTCPVSTLPELLALADRIASAQVVQDWTAQLHPEQDRPKYNYVPIRVSELERDQIVATLRAPAQGVLTPGVMSLREALRDCTCPRPANDEPDDLTVGQCIDKGQCGCQNGVVLCGAQCAPQPSGEPVAWQYLEQEHVIRFSPPDRVHAHLYRPLYDHPAVSYTPTGDKVECPACHGDGYSPKEDLSGDDPCSSCKGTGMATNSAVSCAAREALKRARHHIDAVLSLNEDNRLALAVQGRALIKTIDATLSLPSAGGEASKRCQYCDGSGDVHRADGEWLGICDCPAGRALRGEASKREADIVERMPSRETLIELIMRETTDKITSDGFATGYQPNALVQGCKFMMRRERYSPTDGYEQPEEAAKKFAGFIADAIRAAVRKDG